MRIGIVIIFMLGCIFSACEPKEEPLPIIGFTSEDEQGETVYHTVPDFSFINQDSQRVTNATFEDKIYLVDFFFINCPTICPRVKKQMKRIYNAFEEEDDLLMLSHSIDTRYDTVPALKAYADKLSIRTEKWHLVTGAHDAIFEIADDYFSTALVNEDAPGGYDHSGLIILVDKDRHVRAFADGTIPEAVDGLMEDINKLLKEHKQALANE